MNKALVKRYFKRLWYALWGQSYNENVVVLNLNGGRYPEGVHVANLQHNVFNNCFFFGEDTPQERARWRLWLDSLSAEAREFHEQYPPFPPASIIMKGHQ